MAKMTVGKTVGEEKSTPLPNTKAKGNIEKCLEALEWLDLLDQLDRITEDE